MSPANDVLFAQRAAEFVAFLNDHGEEPRSNPDDPKERRLAGWISNCRAAAAGKPTTFAWSDTRHAVLDEMVPGWGNPTPRPVGPRRSMAESGRDDVRFRRNADDYAAHLSRTGDPPSITSDERREVQLARWMIRNRQQARGVGLSPLYPERRALLDRMFPGWNDSDAGYRFRLRAELCAAWRRHHSSLPSVTSKHEPELELARWLDRARRSASGAPGSPPWSDAREQLLDALLPGWRADDAPTRLDLFEKRAHEYARFLTVRRRHPAHAKEDRTERSLYQWMIRNRRAVAGRKSRHRLTAERREILDRIVPDWNRALFEPAPKPPSLEPDRPRLGSWPLIPRLHDALVQRAKDCASFVAEHRRFPRPESPTAIERSLGSWLAKMRHDAATMHRRDRAPLDEHIPGWDCTDVRHRRRAERCAAFVDEHAAWPQTLGTLPRERELAAFLHESRMSDRSRSARKWSPSHAAALDTLVPGWRDRAF